MVYTVKDYTQDTKIARYAFKKYIRSHYLKDELIHIAILKLWTVRLEHGIVKNPVDTAKNAMITFLRKEQRQVRRHDSLYDDTIDDLPIIEVIAIERPTPDQSLEYVELVKKIVPLTLSMNPKSKKIISLHLKHYTQTEIAERVNTSIPYVNKVVQSFRAAVRQVLD